MCFQDRCHCGVTLSLVLKKKTDVYNFYDEMNICFREHGCVASKGIYNKNNKEWEFISVFPK